MHQKSWRLALRILQKTSLFDITKTLKKIIKKKEKSNVRNENQKPQIKVIKQSENSNEQKSHSPSKNYVKSPSKSF